MAVLLLVDQVAARGCHAIDRSPPDVYVRCRSRLADGCQISRCLRPPEESSVTIDATTLAVFLTAAGPVR